MRRQGLFILTTLLFTATEVCGRRNIEKRATCVSMTELENCDVSGSNTRYTYFIYNQVLDAPSNCGFNSITWSFKNKATGKSYDLSKYKDRNTAIFDKEKYPTGKYSLNVKFTDSSGNRGNVACDITYICEPPVLIFSPSLVQFIRTGSTYTVDMSKSINYDTTKLNPIITMTCDFKSDLMCQTSKPCFLGTAASMKFKAKHDPCQTAIYYTATIQEYGKNVSEKTFIYVDDNVSMFTSIECTKNCDEYGNKYSNPKVSIGLLLKCLKKCSGFDSTTPTWRVEVVGSRILPSSQYRVENNKLIINAGVLNHGEIAQVSANATGKYKTVYQIQTTPSYQQPTCNINPTYGVSLQTEFTITCTHQSSYMQKFPPMYKVTQEKGGSNVVITETPFNEFKVILGATKGKTQEDLTVICRDIFFNEVEVQLPPVTLTKANLDMNSLMDVVGKANAIMSQGNTMRAMQLLTGVTSELYNSNFSEDQIDNAATFVLQSMQLLSVESVFLYDQMSTTLPALYNKKGKSGIMKDMLSVLCKDLAKKNLKQLMKSKYSKLESESAKDNAGIIVKCIEAIIEDENEENSDDDETQPDEQVIFVTTPKSTISDPSITEDYPNYYDESLSTQVDAQKLNAINAIESTSEAIAETLTPGESYHTNSSKTETVISVDRARNLAKNDINVKGVSVRAGKNINDHKDKIISLAITSYHNASLERRSPHVNTNIIDVAFFDMNAKTMKSMRGVQVEIVFNISNGDLKYNDYKFGVSDRTWNNMEIEPSFNVHRVHVKRSHKCYVSIMPRDNDIHVVFINNRRPDLNDFNQYNKKVGSQVGNATVTLESSDADYKDDYFVYVGILRKNPSKTSSKYNISFFTVTCLTLNVENRNWIPGDCNSSLHNGQSSNLKIKCVCNHTSLFAAKYDAAENRLDLVLWTKFESIFFTNYVVFLHVLFVFICYCTALAVAKSRKYHNYGKRLYFLTDNLKNDRYAYLLVVKTGGMHFAGTSSNVVMQLFGMKSNSKPHVLNYPDPEKRILQKNNRDWFVLTNNSHLGEIEYIRLWFDGIGIRPSWYCENIKIIDLQDMLSWEFRVEQWLDFEMDKMQIECEPNSTKSAKENIVINAKKYIRYYYDGEHTWNIFSKSYDNFISYEQRLTVILSQIYTTYTIGILLLTPPEMNTSDSFGYGKFKYYDDILIFGITSGFISFIINSVFVFFFKNSENQNKNSFVRFPKMFKRRSTDIVWIVLLIWIIICMLYLIIFGFWVTFSSSLIWIVTTVISFILSIFVFENVFLIIYNILKMYALKGKRRSLRYDVKVLLRLIENQRRILYRTFGELLMRPYFTRHYNTFSEFYVLKLKQYEKERFVVSHLFRNMCVFMFYITLLYIICLSKTDYLTRMSNEQMEFMIIKGKYATVNFKLLDIETVDDIYQYLNTTIVNTVHATKWYEGYNLIDAGLMNDFNHKILGVVQLRQQRRKQNCDLPEGLYGLDTRCSNKDGVFKEADYQNGSLIGNAIGLKRIYSGGGYIKKLGRTLYNSYFVMNFLKENNWIGINTDVLFIEFWTYNANYNTFNAIRIMVERDESGRLWKSFKIFTTRLFHSSAVTEFLIIIELLIFCLTNFSILITNIVEFVREKRACFKNFWNILDVLIIALSVTITVVYLVKSKITRELLEEFEEANNNEFVNYFHVIALENFNMYISGILLCVATLRLWKFLRFGQVFRIMERTIAVSFQLVVCIAICHIDVFLMFTFYFYLLLGANFYEFESIQGTLTSLMLITFNLKKPEYRKFTLQIRYIHLIFAAFIIASLIFINIYATIIIIHLGESKNYFSNKEKKYTIKDYFLEEVRYFRKMFKRNYMELRLKSGGAGCDLQEDFVCAKEATELYADCVFLPDAKLDVMRLVAICVIRNNQRFGKINLKLSEDDYVMMARMYLLLRRYDASLANKSRQIYVVGSDLSGGRVFVPFHRLQQIEYVVKVLLSGGKRREELNISKYTIKLESDHLRLESFANALRIIRKTLANIKIA